ncbi:Oxaloacetate decarboxylase, gamma chain [Eubacterium ruminantium]|nr:Oxaloacetate decarboxylase, gamma chain [Eubacterium ruminantium]
MKKKLLLFLSVVMLLSLAGCKGSDSDKPFDYSEATMAFMTVDLINQYKDVTDEAVDYYLSEGTELEASFAKGFSQLQTTDKVGAFKSIVNGGDPADATFKNGSNDDVLCTITCNYEERDVDVTVSYVKNKEFYKDKAEARAMLEEAIKVQYPDTTLDELVKQETGMNSADEYIESMLIQEGKYPYTPVQAEVSAVYSKGELLKKAGANTAIGMSTVFCVLVFISFIISLLKFVPRIFDPDKKNKKTAEAEKKVSAPAPTPAPVASTVQEEAAEELSSDDELVAVITAALYAMLSEEKKPNAISKDKLVVRSIRRVK